MEEKSSIIPIENLERRIFFIRGHKVMIDADLAELYGVTTKSLNRAVLRNLSRFPSDFMFQLTKEENTLLRSQIATSNEANTKSLRYQFGTSNVGRGGRRYLPYAFTEHGVAMLSAVLNSERAVEMSVFIVRAFIQLREMIATHKELAHKVEELERGHSIHTQRISSIQEVLKSLIRKPLRPRHPIGFEK